MKTSLARTTAALSLSLLALAPALSACSGDQTGDSNTDNQIEAPPSAENAPVE